MFNRNQDQTIGKIEQSINPDLRFTAPQIVEDTNKRDFLVFKQYEQPQPSSNVDRIAQVTGNKQRR